MKLSEIKTNGHVARRIIVYGPPKTGKTELVGALAASGYRLFWLDLEDGVKTLLRPNSKAKAGLDKIELVRVPDTQTYPIGIQTILKIVKGGNCHVCFEHGAVDCFKCKTKPDASWVDIDVLKFGPKDVLVIDSVSQLVSSTMMHITREQIAKGNEDYKPDWDDWRKQGFLLDRVFSLIQAGGFNFVGISHEEQQKLEDGKMRLVPVGGTGNYSKTFAKYFDDIVYTDIVNGSFKAYSAATPTVNAIIGSRTGKVIGEQGLIELFKD